MNKKFNYGILAQKITLAIVISVILTKFNISAPIAEVYSSLVLAIAISVANDIQSFFIGKKSLKTPEKE